MQQNKTMEERFEEKFLDKNNFWKTIEGRGTYYKPEDVLIFINSEISQEKSKSFQEGREEGIKETRNVIYNVLLEVRGIDNRLEIMSMVDENLQKITK